MNLFENIVLGFVQGITEFFPVSSSGHLWIVETLVFQRHSSIALEAFFHFATLLAITLFFRKTLWHLLCGMLGFGEHATEQRSYGGKLLLATATTVPVALLLQPFVEFELNTTVVAITLFITAFLILIAEYFRSKKSQIFSWNIAFFLGLIQGIAVIPGISRSGITIVFLLLVGIPWKKALEISFFLSIPTILGAFIFLAPGLQNENFHLPSLAVGGGVAFFVALLTLWGMMEHIEKYWKYFSVWCVVLGGVLLLV